VIVNPTPPSQEESGLVEYVCTHPCFVDVFPVKTTTLIGTLTSKGYGLLPNQDVAVGPE